MRSWIDHRCASRPSLAGTAWLALALLLLTSGGHASAAAPEEIGAVGFQKQKREAQAPQLTDYRLALRSRAEHTRVNISWRAIDNTRAAGLPNLFAKVDGRRCTTASYDWCALDRLLRRYAAIGLRANPVLIGTPEWANSRKCKVGRSANACHPVPMAIDDWKRFVSTAVRRYGPNGSFWNELGTSDRFDMSVWEIWNEPNLPGFWDSASRDAASADAAEYADLVRATDDAVDLGAAMRGRTARVAGPSLSSFGRKKSGKWLASFVTERARHRLDVVSGHLYGKTAKRVIGQVDRYRELLPRRPMWITENGFGSGSGCPYCMDGPEAQRQQFDRLMELLGRRPYVDSFTWFMGARHPTFRGTHGLFRDNGKPKPILTAFRRRAALAGP